RHNLYALYQARRVLRTEDAVLVEGYMDVVALHQAGFPQAVAALGTALTAEQVALLRRYGSGCVLAYDADNAGQSATEKGIEIFEAASLPVRVLELPPGDDPDSLVGREGPDAFRARLEKASGIVEYRMERLVRKHDVDTPEGKTAFLKEMLPTLGKIRDVVRWDEYVRMLAERLRAREETVRMLARNHRPPGAPVPQSAPPQQWKRNGGRGYGDRSYPRTPVEPPPTPQHLGAAMTPAVLKAERELVRYLLAQPDALPEARAAVSVEEMQDPTLRAILSCLYEMPQPRANLTAADFVPLLEQEGVHKRLSELLMDEHLEPLTPQLFAGLIKNFQDRRARAALKSLGGAVRRALADQNTRRHDDPDFVQFQEHQQRLKGSS
ncbi:MAG: toprim domain-containing protein, partial [Armatimonadetes bacterium]|nr:toprim domain-containing protein [Armatimonadota bacterium]